MKEVAVGIILRDGLVLVCQRKRDIRYPLRWEFPGGKIEPGETAPQALLRELREELSIEVLVEREFFRQEWMYAEGLDDPGKDGSFSIIYFLVRLMCGEPVNNAFEEIRWVSPAVLRTMDILEGNRNAVELLSKHASEHVL